VDNEDSNDSKCAIKSLPDIQGSTDIVNGGRASKRSRQGALEVDVVNEVDTNDAEMKVGSDSGDDLSGSSDDEEDRDENEGDDSSARADAASPLNELSDPKSKRQRKVVDRDAFDATRPARVAGKFASAKGKRSASAGGAGVRRGNKRLKTEETPILPKSSRKSKMNVDHIVGIDSAVSENAGLSEYHKIQQLLNKWQRNLGTPATRVLLHSNAVSLLEIWLRLLKLFHQRLKEANKWFGLLISLIQSFHWYSLQE
jgi:hypothetical protein